VDLKKLIDKYGWKYFLVGYKYAKTRKIYAFNLNNPKFTKILRKKYQTKLTALLHEKIGAMKNFKAIVQ